MGALLCETTEEAIDTYLGHHHLPALLRRGAIDRDLEAYPLTESSLIWNQYPAMCIELTARHSSSFSMSLRAYTYDTTTTATE
jgi:hypothetical protein